MTNWRGGVYDKYRELCLQAATQDQIFSGFKGNPLYKPILEHVSYHQGLQYLNRIKSSSSEVYTEENFNNNEFSIKSKQLLKLLNKCKFSVSSDETRHYLSGIFLHQTEVEDKNYQPTKVQKATTILSNRCFVSNG